MATTKKVADMTEISALSGDYNIIVHDGTGLKKTPLSKIGISDGAGAHNAWYEDVNLGSSVSSEQWTEIKAGRFRGLPIGGYWSNGGVNYRIAAFNYLKGCGDTEITNPHVLIVPDKNLATGAMNNTDTTAGGYQGSAMRTTNLALVKTQIKNMFGSNHILTYKGMLTNAVSNGRPSGVAWFDCDIELMNEQMLFGSSIVGPASDGTNIPANDRLEKSQLPLFAFRPDLISANQWFWLRDVTSAFAFARVAATGIQYSYGASDATGIRPFFLIY